jgi:tRNA(fMet)-specific endonuclease VapC
MELIADTTFLVGLWRRQAWAISFAKTNTNRSLGLPWIVLGEFWHGANRANHDPDAVMKFLSMGRHLTNAEVVIPFYAALCSQLQEENFYKGIGQNDLWIAATALAFDKPLVTRNQRHFGKIAGLKLELLE